MKKKYGLLALLIAALSVTACNNEDATDVNVATTIKSQDSITVVANSDSVAGKYEITGEIEANAIKATKGNLIIVKSKNGNTEVSVTSTKEILDGESLFTIETKKNLDVAIVETLTANEFDVAATVKRAGSNTLLGDFDASGVVDESDLSDFAKYYDGTNATYDIFPASKGTDKWSNIYCVLTGDGKVDLKDLGAFGYNYGQSNPEKIVKAVTISGGSTVGIDGTITLTADVSYEKATDVTHLVDWSSSNISVATVNASGVVTGKTVGDTTITASKDGKSATKKVTVSAEKVEAPFTWNNATVYFVINDRFYNGNTSNDNSYGRVTTDATGKNIGTFHGGDIAGLTEKMDYFKGIGVTAIWFTATYEQMHGWCAGGKSGDFAHYGYHGYYAIDWSSLDKNMGTVNEMKTFVDTAHENGIRVVMDVVMNHTGYPNLKDMDDYGYGATGKADWTPNDGNWNGMHDFIPYSDGSAWTNWWGLWARAGIPGSAPEGSSELTEPLANLPDIVTEATNPIHSKFFEVKWGKESNGYSDWIVADSVRAKGPNQVPAEYIINSLAAWVEKFGIDGFRCDTAKHIEIWRWKELKDASKNALAKWRSNNPTAPGADWTDEFWMTGEHWNFSGGGGEYYNNGFDNMIDFGFKGSVPLDAGSMGSKWSEYASKNGQLLPYISSHDTGSVFYNGNEGRQISAGTGLLLTPGPVQIFYGDEIGRDNGDGGSDADQGSRSDFQWNKEGNNINKHWAKVGTFRANNPAVGAGSQTDLGNNTYGRKWNDNAVVIKVGAGASESVNVSGIFSDGASVRNAYNGETGTVSGGKVTFSGENGVILIESAN